MDYNDGRFLSFDYKDGLFLSSFTPNVKSWIDLLLPIDFGWKNLTFLPLGAEPGSRLLLFSFLSLIFAVATWILTVSSSSLEDYSSFSLIGEEWRFYVILLAKEDLLDYELKNIFLSVFTSICSLLS